MPTTMWSIPSGNGGSSGVPSTVWRSGTGTGVSRPGSACSGVGSAVFFENSMGARPLVRRGGPRRAIHPARYTLDGDLLPEGAEALLGDAAELREVTARGDEAAPGRDGERAERAVR